jgi:hypothetical protein
MSFVSRILGRVGKGHGDVTGSDRGAPAADHRDQDGPPGTSADDGFVGRATGQDAGYLDTGAERRSAKDSPDDSERAD